MQEEERRKEKGGRGKRGNFTYRKNE